MKCKTRIKELLISIIVLLSLLSCGEPDAQKERAKSIFPKGEKITSDHFTGEVWLHMFVRDDSTLNAAVGNVTFEAGARTKWHLHRGGQILIITDGVGWYQEKGSARREVHEGEVITCLPNLEHWHGASSEQSMSHMAMSINTERGEVVWGKEVSEEEYMAD
ncbi:cupin domain-containing protein [Fulvivirga ligni]|uniref:cupin domain-containing protein n=1 Tax=Fulvivirga ligni TaxID=2904246 RepID=UPI001F36C44C|nr:cupin domain-containing protein [Fulvivirga ligni]UII19025.1 cupin domain-containing protein [Fulvivirga ligni]